MFDEDTMPTWMQDHLKLVNKPKVDEAPIKSLPFLAHIDTSQPPPSALPMIPMVNTFPLGSVPR